MKPKFQLRHLFPTCAVLAMASGSAFAADYYWNTTTTDTWATGANWSDDATTGGTTGTVPLSTGAAVPRRSGIAAPACIRSLPYARVECVKPFSGHLTQNQASSIPQQDI